VVEDLGTYVEVDPNYHLSIGGVVGGIYAANLNRGEDAYVYKSFGADHFNRIELEFESNISWSTTSIYGMVTVGFANVVNDVSGWSDCLNVRISRNAITLGSDTDSDSYTSKPDISYYLRLYRATGSDTAELKIYSDSARTTLLDTLSVDGVGSSVKFQYFYPAASYNIGKTEYNIIGSVANFLFLILPPVGGGAQIIGLSDI